MGKKIKILITGSSGQLGQSFMSLSKMFPIYDFLFFNKKSLDISDFDFVKSKIESLKPEIIINCAAYTDVNNAENDKSISQLVNYKAVKNIANLCKELNIFLIHFSTDYVFENNLSIENSKKKCVTKRVTNKPYNEHVLPSPNHTYSLSKYLGENSIIKASLSKYLIVRTSWLYSEFSDNFVLKVLKNLKNEIPFNVVDDQFGSPTYAYDLASSVLNVLNKFSSENSGIYHYSSVDFCSRFEFALQIKKFINSPTKITPVASVDKLRPFFSALDPNKFCVTFNQDKYLWKDRLFYFLKYSNIYVS